MNLKEAFATQNKLDKAILEAKKYLSNRSNVTKTVQKHLRNSVNKEVEDTEKELPKSTVLEVEDGNNKMIEFLLFLTNEKISLSKLIEEVKNGLDVNIDLEISNNKERTSTLNALKLLSDIRMVERNTRSSDYKFNGEGNQVTYTYEVIEKTSPDFDREKVVKEMKKITKEIEETSTSIDKLKINTEVGYVFPYDITDEFHDIFIQFCSK